MEIFSTTFLRSYTRAADCKADRRPEFALIGRSNVGKSSLINMLLNKKTMAKVSSRPGKTRLLNAFLVNEQWILMDMPGYGWARLPRVERDRSEQENTAYLRTRANLACLLVLLDCRHSPQAIDLDFIRWTAQIQRSLVLVFTKADKLSKSQLHRRIANYQYRLREDWEELPPYFITSAKSYSGRSELLAFLHKTAQVFLRESS